MSNIKHKDKDKIKEKNIASNAIELNCPNHPVFCFKYITTNSRYNYGYFGKKQRVEKLNCIESLFSKIEEWTNGSWKEMFAKPKQTGIETIVYGDITFESKVCNNFSLAKDTKIIIMRYNSSNQRILGVKRDKCPIFHIIGYDFDFSAYNH